MMIVEQIILIISCIFLVTSLGVRPGPKGTMVFPLVNAQPEEGQYHQNDNAHTDANAHVLHLPTRERKKRKEQVD